MRTTLTLDSDISVRLNQLRLVQTRPFKEIVNEVLRAGLDAISQRRKARASYHTPSVSLGGCLAGDIDNVHEALSIAEGDDRQ